MEVMENVPDDEGCEAWRRLHDAYYLRLTGRCAGLLFDIVSGVFCGVNKSAFEVFEKKCRLYRALSKKYPIISRLQSRTIFFRMPISEGTW